MFDHTAMQEKWTKTWHTNNVYEPTSFTQPKKPFYNLMMFPYPSAEGLHVGNMYAFSGADIYGRYKRLRGYDVFEPIGLDGFGIHSENYALKIGKHPADQAKVSEANFYRQLSLIGNGFAWNERLETYDPEYYKWTQWLFVQMFKKGLAYKGKSLVNWCPSCKTVLADEQVEDGKCERCKSEVGRKEAEQWFFKITEYSDRLLNNIDGLKWPDPIRTAQRRWIGKAKGFEIFFPVQDSAESLSCWTTSWHTIFGATFVVIAPEHPLLSKLKITGKYKLTVDAYVKQALLKTEQQRQIEAGEKTGVFTGTYLINPATNQPIPLWIADYVLMGVGTGVVMGAPAHDQRDFEFAKKFDLDITQVIHLADTAANTQVEMKTQGVNGPGKMMNSGTFDGLDAETEGRQHIAAWLEKNGKGSWKTTYHLRDWLISRQRFWGPPIPMVYCEACGWQAVPEDQLPVELPYIENYKPTGDGRAPLEQAPESWLFTTCPKCNGKAKRETDVSDTFLDSSWYFLRYPTLAASPKVQSTTPFDPIITKAWMPVSAYIGGAEHAVLHLLYSRFVTMALKDWGYLDFEEPFPFLFGHGLIIKDGAKMSKSKGNVVNPDEYITKFGSDSLRTYLMFLGPYDQGGDFRDTGIAGMYRWMQKVWKLFHEQVGTAPSSPELKVKLHKTIAKCTQDMDSFKFNTAIASLMECMNTWTDQAMMEKNDALSLLTLLAPFAPFMAEEIYHQVFGASADQSIHKTSWPTFDSTLLVDKVIEIVVQINGKVRMKLSMNSDEVNTAELVEKNVLDREEVKQLIGDNKVIKKIAIPNKLINFVINK